VDGVREIRVTWNIAHVGAYKIDTRIRPSLFKPESPRTGGSRMGYSGGRGALEQEQGLSKPGDGTRARSHTVLVLFKVGAASREAREAL
jgi:hypothetical protein